MIDHNDPFSVMGCLHETFLECQEEMKVAKIDCGTPCTFDFTLTITGTTALVSLWIRDKFYIANAGDSRAVACINRREKRMTVDHKPLLPSEVWHAHRQHSHGLESADIEAQGRLLRLKGKGAGQIERSACLRRFLVGTIYLLRARSFWPV